MNPHSQLIVDGVILGRPIAENNFCEILIASAAYMQKITLDNTSPMFLALVFIPLKFYNVS